jgi:hypothetical protein
MTDKITEADCKLLTEKLLGECWHSNYISADSKCYECGAKINITDIFLKRKTFTTPSDQHAVFSGLVKTKRWLDFKGFVLERRWSEPIHRGTDWSAWLWISPERFYKLVSLYLKEEGK